MRNSRTTVGIVGASGMTGGELLRLLATHPKVEVKFAHSRHHADKSIGDVHPHLENLYSIECTGAPIASLAKDADVLFLALGHGESKEVVGLLKEYSGTIIDFTIDHRLDTTFQYGITELSRNELGRTKRIANPGCFATAAVLAAAPFVKEKIVAGNLFFSSVTGSSGAGNKPIATTHHPFRDSNLFAYKVFSHQHEPEILTSVQSLGFKSGEVILTAQSGPFVRGIHSTLYFQTTDAISPDRLTSMMSAFYASSPFVRVRNTPPSVKQVVGSNFCDLYVTSRGNSVVVISVIDNLVKGAAGQAIQNMNVALGFDEKEGLWNPPCFP